MIARLPVAELAPLDYRYGLDVAAALIAGHGATSGGLWALCNVPALAAEVHQRLPHALADAEATGHAAGEVGAALWVEPLTATWTADLARLSRAVQPGGRLVVLASQPLGRMLPERRMWQDGTGIAGSTPLGTGLRGMGRLLKGLARAGFRIEAQYGLHPPAAMLASRVAGQLERRGRADLGDRWHFRARLSYCTTSPAARLSTVALVICRRDGFSRRAHREHREVIERIREDVPAVGLYVRGNQPPASLPNSVVSASSVANDPVSAAVAGLDAWFETLRGESGYGGPVAHWWQQSLLYTGTGLDWRYEGIITGYLLLWERTGDPRWLDKACRAGADLVAGQDEDGHFAGSAFEINPATAGTPHEAACDVGLLHLALALRGAGAGEWQRYAACAERNLRRFYLDELWNPAACMIGDHPWRRGGAATFVPNKAATACEALFLMAELSGDDRWVEAYALPTLVRMAEHQVDQPGRLDGAIAQNSLGARRVEKYFPIYNARCIPALLRAYRWTGDERYADRALRIMAFIARWQQADGSLPTVIYPDTRVNAAPSWIAPLGDVLRAADELAPFGFCADLSAMRARLLAGQDVSGGIQTGRDFAHQAGPNRQTLPDVRDVLHVAGWCDKTFRYLAAHAGPDIPAGSSARFEVACAFRGRAMNLVETPDALEITSRGQVCYRWVKGEAWPQVAAPEFWLR